MARLINLTYIICLTLTTGACSLSGASSPSENDAKKALMEKVTSESEGRIKLISFNKTNGQNKEYQGVKAYFMEFKAEILFTETSRWLKGKTGSKASFKTKTYTVPKDEVQKIWSFTQAPFSIVATSGEKKIINGAIIYEMTDNGWRFSGIQIAKVITPGLDPDEIENKLSKLKLIPGKGTSLVQFGDDVNKVKSLLEIKPNEEKNKDKSKLLNYSFKNYSMVIISDPAGKFRAIQLTTNMTDIPNKTPLQKLFIKPNVIKLNSDITLGSTKEQTLTKLGKPDSVKKQNKMLCNNDFTEGEIWNYKKSGMILMFCPSLSTINVVDTSLFN